MYRNMTYILMVLGSAVMAYVITVYFAKRKKFYLRLLEIGADRKRYLKFHCVKVCTMYCQWRL